MKLKDQNLPPITEEDKEFALRICKEYPELEFEGICRLIRNVEFNLSGDYEDITKHAKYSESLKKLFDRDIEFKEINITTNKGIIQIRASDTLLFNYFLNPIKRAKRQYKDDLTYLSEALPQGAKDGVFGIIVDYFYKTPLGSWQRLVVIGMFLVHFKLFAREPILTEAEYNKKGPTHDSYKHYLAERAEPRVKTYLKSI